MDCYAQGEVTEEKIKQRAAKFFKQMAPRG